MNGISYPNIFPEPASHRLDGPAVSALIIGRGNICMGKDGRAVRNQPAALRYDMVPTGRQKDGRDKGSLEQNSSSGSRGISPRE